MQDDFQQQLELAALAILGPQKLAALCSLPLHEHAMMKLSEYYGYPITSIDLEGVLAHVARRAGELHYKQAQRRADMLDLVEILSKEASLASSAANIGRKVLQNPVGRGAALSAGAMVPAYAAGSMLMDRAESKAKPLIAANVLGNLGSTAVGSAIGNIVGELAD